ncbi:glycyl radical protein [Natranaerofaba carboxydovora]|uniref:glycyl radical protein n=1 Tax=Natranaerofaba carboxydovora TaxID=2742683 RepID=UPI001F12B4B1|nr:glycyl radical protein [Natranaerofaba carboxydovora]UMZ73449.1 Choline trimethylamine-lyase [Natranaerofaba carboxydovora]
MHDKNLLGYVGDLPEITPRIKKLTNDILNAVPEIDPERARLLTQSYKETEALPMVIRRAKALEKILNEMTIVIRDDELIVGNQTTKPRSSPVFPEFSNKWLMEEFDRLPKRLGDAFKISEETKDELKEIFNYWDGKTSNELAASLMSKEAEQAQDAGVFTVGNYFFGGVGHTTVDYEEVLTYGFKGIIEKAKTEKDNLNVAKPEDIEKEHFLNAVIITLKAAINFAKRFSKEAKKLAKECEDKTRKDELHKIAEVCDKVPEYPAGSFHEALQSFWFVQLIIQLESSGHSISPGRFDQYIFPYLKNDIEKDDLTLKKAQEILDALWVKFNDINKVRDEGSTKAFGGYPMFQNLIVGGQTPDGLDASNLLSFMCLEATTHIKMPQPSISVRIWDKSLEELTEKTVEVTKLGLGMPAYYNDEVIIPSLVNRGLTLEDARDYCIIGCVEPQKGGKTEGWHDSAFFNMAKVLELTINNGVENGKQLGPKTGEFTSFNSFEEFKLAFERQMEYFVALLVNAINSVDIAHMKRAPLPFLSSIIQNCIEKGKTVQEGGAYYNFTGPQGVGVANVGDSFAVIEKLVFNEQKLSLEELKKALDNNFEDEDLRQKLLNEVAKYGNDIEEVDMLTREGALIYCKEVEKHTNPRGGIYQPGLYPVSANVPLGAATGATPEGRKARTPLADGVSPVSGMDRNGPTAAINSVAKLDHHIASNGTLLNQKFHPSSLEGESGQRNLAALINGFFDQKGLHIQNNVIDKETLIKAQKNPDKYSSLVVRVAGYSAYFTSLDKSLQDDIINRTEQNF